MQQDPAEAAGAEADSGAPDEEKKTGGNTAEANIKATEIESLNE